MIRAVLLLLALSAPLAAQSLPARYEVINVSSSDALNIRQNPDATSEKIGELAHDATGIEILRLSNDGRWGRIGLPEGNGWVAMRYLEPMGNVPADTVPRPLSCFGTEPFWSFSLDEEELSFTVLDTLDETIALDREVAASNNFLLQGTDSRDARYSMVVTRGLCADGMSDREFGFRASLFIEGGDDAAFQSGCCTLEGR